MADGERRRPGAIRLSVQLDTNSTDRYNLLENSVAQPQVSMPTTMRNSHLEVTDIRRNITVGMESAERIDKEHYLGVERHLIGQ